MYFDHEDQRHGTGRWASEEEIRRAGLFHGEGLHLGHFGGQRLRWRTDNPGIVLAGSGAGKCRDLGVETILRSGSTPMLVFDPKAELAQITRAAFARYRVFMWCWNPAGLHGSPQHRLNPLDILTRDNPLLHSDCMSLVAGMIPLSGGDGQYFELKAREYITALTISLVERDGFVTFPSLWRVIQTIESNASAWDAHLTFMEHSAYPDLRDAAGSMWTRQRDTPREFGAIIGTIKAHFNVLNDPILSASLENPDFSLRDLTAEQIAAVFINVPRDFLKQWALVTRVIFITAIKYKERAPSSRPIMMWVDEAGQMGRFDALLEGQTYNRGAGALTIPLYQDLGQIERAFGRSGIQTLLGSSGHQRFFGIREIDTARLVSAMLGNETLAYDDTLQQEAANRQRWEAARRYMEGGDPIAAAFDFDHYGQAAQNRTRMQRPLLTPDEVLHLPERKMILFTSGLDLHPILADKYAYWEQRELNGLWLPSPFHPPFDRVKLRGRWRSYWRDVVTEDVPPELAHYPQYQSGRVQYVAGYRPW